MFTHPSSLTLEAAMTGKNVRERLFNGYKVTIRKEIYLDIK